MSQIEYYEGKIAELEMQLELFIGSDIDFLRRENAYLEGELRVSHARNHQLVTENQMDVAHIDFQQRRISELEMEMDRLKPRFQRFEEVIAKLNEDKNKLSKEKSQKQFDDMMVRYTRIEGGYYNAIGANKILEVENLKLMEENKRLEDELALARLDLVRANETKQEDFKIPQSREIQPPPGFFLRAEAESNHDQGESKKSVDSDELLMKEMGKLNIENST